ncbi:MAG: ATP-binding cassette domain-containing protein [Pseudomonadota bacterium]
MIQLDRITLRRGPEVLLDQTSLVVHSGQKVGLVGANGCGKSSLFALLLGELDCDQGRAQMPSDWNVAHMAQQITELDRPAIEFVLDGDAPLRAAQLHVTQAEQDGEGERIAAAHQALDDAGGYDARARAGALLNGLGFAADQHEQPVQSFYGGWRIRLSLARALMSPSDLLLLDEPTNHLDLETVLWLEDWLQRYSGTLMLISHDRDFLDQTVQSIAHIEQGRIQRYTGDYSEFERQRAERMALQQARYTKQQRQVAHMQAFIDRFRAKASKARQAQARLKALDRMERIAPAHVDSPFSFSFTDASRAADPLISCHEVRLGYGEHVVLDPVGLTVAAGDRIGLLGVNGAGKSTLVKALAGELPPIDGRLTFSRNVQIGYFAQHQLEQVDPTISPLDHLAQIADDTPEQDLRDYLGGFAFSGDLCTDACARLSGGERARLVLALIIWQRPNLLLLDEPTNHLDLAMRHALTLALQGFDGAVVTVSHDRHLLKETVDDYWLIDRGTVQPFAGGLDAYRRRVAEPDPDAPRARPGAAPSNRKAERQRKAAERRRLQPLLRAVQRATEQLAAHEQALAEVEQALADADLYQADRANELKALLDRQAASKQTQRTLEDHWMRAEQALEDARAEFSATAH